MPCISLISRCYDLCLISRWTYIGMKMIFVWYQDAFHNIDIKMLWFMFDYKILSPTPSRLGMSVTTQSGSGRQYVTGSWRNKESCSECVMCLGALTHTKPQESYFAVVYLYILCQYVMIYIHLIKSILYIPVNISYSHFGMFLFTVLQGIKSCSRTQHHWGSTHYLGYACA